MNENDRSLEIGLILPKVSKETISFVENQFSEQTETFLDETYEMFGKENPGLRDLALIFAEGLGSGQRADAVSGAFVTYRALRISGRLPIVTSETISRFLMEAISADGEAAQIILSSTPEDDSVKQRVRELGSEIVELPGPLDYAEENPNLMVYVASVGINDQEEQLNPFGISSMFVYELLRRQSVSGSFTQQMNS